jgi:antitoxin component HigA of HigAB toxin-antitoxin module
MAGAKGGEPDGDEKKKKDEEAAAAKAAADEDEKKKMASEEEKAKALASGGIDAIKALVVDQARQLATLQASLAAKADVETRSAILATRPDLSADAIKALTVVSTKDLTAVLATFPRVGNQAAAAANVNPTRGARTRRWERFRHSGARRHHIERRMGLSMAGAGIKREGTTLGARHADAGPGA